MTSTFSNSNCRKLFEYEIESDSPSMCSLSCSILNANIVEASVSCGVQVKVSKVYDYFSEIKTHHTTSAKEVIKVFKNAEVAEKRRSFVKNELEAFHFWAGDVMAQKVFEDIIDDSIKNSFSLVSDKVKAAIADFDSTPLGNDEELMKDAIKLKRDIEEKITSYRKTLDLISDLEIDSTRGHFLDSSSGELKLMIENFKTNTRTLNLTEQYDTFRSWQEKAILLKKSFDEKSTTASSDTSPDPNPLHFKNDTSDTLAPEHAEL